MGFMSGMKKNKILILVSNDIATDQRMNRICKSLYNSAFEVEIVGRKLQNSMDLMEFDYKQKRFKMIFNKGVLFYIMLNLKYFFYLVKIKPDAVYAVDADTSIAAVFYKIIFKSKMIFDAHELFSEVPELNGRNFKKKIWKIVEKSAISISDLRITVSDSISSYFEKLYNKKFIVIRNLPTKKQYTQIENPEKFIIYQGALNKGRCIEQLLKISAKTGINVKIVGEGDLSEYLRKFAKKLNLEVEKIFLGKLKPQELTLLTQKAWLGFNLLQKCSLSYYFSLSNKTFDYVQAGIPQIMSDFPEYLNLNNIFNFGITSSLNEDEIEKTILKLMNDENFYNSLKKGTIKASEQLIWENEEFKLIENLKNLFKNI